MLAPITFRHVLPLRAADFIPALFTQTRAKCPKNKDSAVNYYHRMFDQPGPYNLIFDKRSGYLYAKISAGTIDSRTSTAYITEIAYICKDLGYDRLMIERDIPVMLPVGSLYFAAKELC